MTDIEKKALALVNEIEREEGEAIRAALKACGFKIREKGQ